MAFRDTLNILIGSPPGLVTCVVNVLPSQSLIFILIAKLLLVKTNTLPSPGATMECCIMVKLNNQNEEGKIYCIFIFTKNPIQYVTLFCTSGLSAPTNVISSTSEEILI